jgi:hypothetical protein
VGNSHGDLSGKMTSRQRYAMDLQNFKHGRAIQGKHKDMQRVHKDMGCDFL